jgi:hypothetical protein
MVLYLCVLIVFSLHRESLKLILATNPSLRWFCHSWLWTVDTTKSCTDSEKYYLNLLWNMYIFQIQNSQ